MSASTRPGETPWTLARAEWIKTLNEADLLRLIAAVLQHYGRTDETGGDHLETRDSVLWLATRGVAGEEWGHVGVMAQELGLWPGRPRQTQRDPTVRGW